MDPQTMLIGAAIFVVSAIVIYLISVCSMREKTFEEVIEEQRQMQAEEQKKLKLEKKDKIRKRYGGKKGKKSEKTDEKGQQLASSGSDTDVIEPEIEPVKAVPTKAEKKKKDKGTAKVRDDPIVRQEELYEPLVKEQVVEPTRIEVQVQAEPAHREHTPKQKRSKKDREESIEAQIIVTEEVQVKEVVPVKAEVTRAEPKKPKKKADVGGGDSSGGTDAMLLQTVRKGNLSEATVTTLIEILLNKQGGNQNQEEWTKKSKQADAVTVLKKQLEDKERALQGEQQLAHNAAQKLRDLRAELARERQRNETLDNQLQEKLDTSEKEKDALRKRMQQSHEQHKGEMTNMRHQMEAMKGQYSENQTTIIQRLTEENKKLKEANAHAQAAAMNVADVNALQQQVKIMQEELNKNAVQLNTSNNSKKSLEKQLVHLKEQMHKKETSQHDAEAVVKRKVNEMTEELRRTEAEKGKLGKDLEMARSNIHHSEQEVTNLRNLMKDQQAQEQQLKESYRVKADLDKQVKAMEARVAELEHKHRDSEDQLKQVKEENTLLTSQLKETKERTSGEGEESPDGDTDVNGEVAAQVKADQTSVNLRDHMEKLTEKDTEITKLQADLQSKVDELAQLTSDLNTQKTKNNALREKNWKAMDALSKTEKMAEGASSLKATLSDKEAEIKRLREELEMAKKEKHELASEQVVVVEKVTELKQQSASVTELKQQLSTEVQQLKGQLASQHEQLAVLAELRGELACKDKELQKVTELKEQLKVKDEELKVVSEMKERLASQDKELKSVSELQSSLASKDEKLELLAQQLEALKKQNDNVIQDKEEAEILAEKARKLLAKYEENARQSELDMQALREALDKAEREHAPSERVEMESVEIQRAAPMPTEELSNLSSALESKETEVKRYQAELEMLNKQNAEVLQEKVQAEEEGSSAKVKVTQLEQQLEELKQQLRTKEELLEVAEQKKKVLDQKQEGVERVKQDEQEEMKRLREQLKASDEEHQNVLQAMTALEEKHRQEEKGSLELKAELTQVHTVLEAERTKMATLQEALDLKNAQEIEVLSTQESVVSKATAEAEKLNAELSAKATEVESLQNEVKTLKKAEAANKTQAEEFKQITENLTKSSKKLTQIEKELQVVRKENQELRAGCAQAVSALTAAETSAETTIAHVQAELSSKVNEVERLSNLLEESQTEIHELRQAQAAQVQKESAEVQSAAPGQAAATSLTDVTILTRVQEKSTLDVTRILNDLEAREAELAIMQTVLGQKEAEARTYKAQAAESERLREQLDNRASEVAGLLHQLQLQTEKTNETHCQYVEARESLRFMESYTDQFAALQEDLNCRVAEVVRLQEELETQRLENTEMQRLVAQGPRQFSAGHTTAAEPPSSVLAELTEQVEVKTAEIANLRDIVKDYWIKNNELKEKLESWEESHEAVESTSAAGVPVATPSSEEVNQLQQDLHQLQQDLADKVLENGRLDQHNVMLLAQAEELQEKNKQYVDALHQAEQATQLTVNGNQNDSEAEQKKTKLVLQRIFPEITVSDTQNYTDWITAFEKQASQYSISALETSSSTVELEESRQAQARLQAQVQHYQTVLADTEGVLTKLQSSVEEEENKWHKKVKTSDEKVKQLEQNVQSLQESLSSLESDKLSLQSQLSESTLSLTSLKSDLAEVAQKSTDVEEDVCSLKKQLEEEQKSKKTLHSANVKLNGMLKTGQDALKADQELIAKLQNQLAEKSKGLANGNSQPQEIVQLKETLARTQKQLEQEVQANKQLTQKLGAGAANKDSGTSV